MVLGDAIIQLFQEICTCICAVGVTSTSRGYWISSTEFRSDGTSGRTAERPSGQCTSTLVATSLPTVTHRFCEPPRIQNRLYIVLQDPSWVNSPLCPLPVLIRGGKFLPWGLCSTLLKRHIQSKQIFNYVCQTVIYAAGVPPESQRTGITLIWSGRRVTQQHAVVAPVSHLSFNQQRR